MSLINKMLQDLDARRVQGEGAIGHTFNPVGRPGRRSASTIIISITTVIAGLVLMAGAYAAWRFYQRTPARPAAQSVTFSKTPAPGVAPPAAAPAAPAVVVTHSPGVVQQVTPLPRADEAADGAAPASPAQAPAETEAPEAAPRAAAGKPALPAPADIPAPRTSEAAKRPAQAKPGPAPQRARSADAAGAGAGRVMSNQQQAEARYRSATAALQEGRVREAVRSLEEALAFEPRHDAARQTLVGLLIESKRSDEAMRVLQSGLVLDPRQPAMAMLLARLQIEHGGTGIETLLRSLPYAAGDAEYHAFLGGALQRAQRHREAVEQYRLAVAAQPGNGVWWMGLGISLQAEKRAAEAADAYGRALATGTLAPELRTFVERRLGQARR